MDPEADRFRSLFHRSATGMALHRAILDDEGRLADYTFEALNPAYEQAMGVRAQDVQGRRVREVLPEPEASNAIARFADVAEAGSTLRAEHYDASSGRHYSLVAYPARDGEFAVSLEDITPWIASGDVMTRMVQEISGFVGGQFLRQLVLNLAELLDADYVLVGEYLGGSSERIRCHALFANGEVQDDFVYDLSDTPCAKVVHGDVCIYPERVQQTYPNDFLLTEMGVEAYVGGPLRGADGSPLGIIAVLWKSPLPHTMRAASAVRLFAPRAASELERKRSEEALQRHTRELEEARRRQDEASARLQQMVEELAEAKDKSQRANQLKSAFVATVSHEIRTPLNAILGVAQLLEASSLSPQQCEDAATIRAAAKVLLQLINDVLDLSKIESGRLCIESAPFPLLETLENAVRILEPETERKGLRLECDPAPDLPAWIAGDSARLHQILLNLLSNAVKFTESGHVRLHCRPLVGDSPRLRFEVEDSGIGVAPQARADLFTPFAQGDASFTRRYGGTGLGLAVCRSLVEAMGGAIGFLPVPTGGSRFWFEIPAVSAEPPAKEQPSIESYAGLLAGARILLAEDNIVNQKVAVRLLERMGCRVDVAPNGREAVRMWAGPSQYDAVLMDCQMPEMDGFQTTQAIRAGEKSGRRIPIIALTANAMAGERQVCLRAGMDDYLSKPISVEMLGATLARWVQSTQAV